jgi:hypothetical protein
LKTVVKGKRFQDVEDTDKTAKAELNAVPLEAFAVFKHFSNDATHVFNLTEITLNFITRSRKCAVWPKGRGPARDSPL